ADEGYKALDFAMEVVVRLKRGRVEQDRQHAVGQAIGLGRVAARIAGQSPRQDVGDDAQAVALVTAERQDGAGRVAVEHLRIGRGATLRVDDTVFGDGDSFVEGYLELSFRDGAGGDIPDDRRAVLHGDAHGHGVSGQAAVDATDRGDENAHA